MDGAILELDRSERPASANLQMDFVSSLCGYNLRRAMTRITTDFGHAISDTGLRPVLITILSVAEENPGVNQGIIGEALGIARANMAPLMNELEKMQLLRRVPSQHDRRALQIFLTLNGRSLLQKCKQRITTHEDRMLRNLSSTERKELIRLVNKIAK